MSQTTEFGIPLYISDPLYFDGQRDQKIEYLLPMKEDDDSGYVSYNPQSAELLIANTWSKISRVVELSASNDQKVQFPNGGLDIVKIYPSKQKDEILYKAIIYPEWNSKQLETIEQIPEDIRDYVIQRIYEVYPRVETYEGSMHHLILSEGDYRKTLYMWNPGVDYTQGFAETYAPVITTRDGNQIWQIAHSIVNYKDKDNNPVEVLVITGMQCKDLGNNEKAVLARRDRFREQIHLIKNENANLSELYKIVKPIFDIKILTPYS